MVKRIEFRLGITIATAAQDLVAAAVQAGEAVEAMHNDILLTAEPTTPPEEVIQHWRAVCDRKAEEWRKTPAGQAATAARKGATS